ICGSRGPRRGARYRPRSWLPHRDRRTRRPGRRCVPGSASAHAASSAAGVRRRYLGSATRRPSNGGPKPEEVASCLPYLQRQVELLQPRLIVAVGRIAAQNLLATDTPIGRLRGQVHRFGERATPLIVTYHPAYLLRSPGEKRKAWVDLKFARDELARLRSQPMATAG